VKKRIFLFRVHCHQWRHFECLRYYLMRGKNAFIATLKSEEHKRIVTYSDCNCKYNQSV